MAANTTAQLLANAELLEQTLMSAVQNAETTQEAAEISFLHGSAVRFRQQNGATGAAAELLANAETVSEILMNAGHGAETMQEAGEFYQLHGFFAAFRKQAESANA